MCVIVLPDVKIVRYEFYRYGAIRARNAKGDRLLLFIGVIDILQSYRYGSRCFVLVRVRI